ncbi:MAG: isocitrate lyase/PEP mutase family protein [Deltaproteobacteria bacterium]|nr:isocitrate lyase/PEP mutase family protein [Deltaproteobacteria bacterium]
MVDASRRTKRKNFAKGEVFPVIGVYDVFSASLSAKYFDGIFVSGFSFAASHYGLPDIGLISWTDIVGLVHRIRTVLPDPYILVDIDDGYADVEVACHVVSLLESAGASGVVMEDQKRPRRCGHLDGKQILNLDEYVTKLRKVLDTRRSLDVVARTDVTEVDEIRKRATAFAEAGADAILVDGIGDLSLIRELSGKIDKAFAFNQIAGGKSPSYGFQELKDAGVSMVIYSTPCLFAAQSAIDHAIRAIKGNHGHLSGKGEGAVTIKNCNAILEDNLRRRDNGANPFK